MKTIKKLMARIWLFFVRPSERVPETQTATIHRINKTTPSEERMAASETGAFATLAELLPELDAKFDRLRKTKFRRYRGCCADMSALVKNVGCYIPGPGVAAYADKSDALRVSTRPGFLLVSLNDQIIPGSEEISVFCDWLWISHVPKSNIDFSKIQFFPKTWDLYELGVGVAKTGPTPSFWSPLAYAAIDRAGAVHELNWKKETSKYVGKCRQSIVQHQWTKAAFPDFGRDFAGDDGYKSMFTWLINVASLRDWHWTVNIASADSLHLSVSIPDNHAKYFFKNRKFKGKKIFHAVAAHYRNTKTGTTTVKTHYRGSRSFEWEGYQVNIQLPGLHSPIITRAPKFQDFESAEECAITVADASARIGQLLDA